MPGPANYIVRVGRPGYITQDTAQFLHVVPQTRNVALVPDPILTERYSDNDRYSTAVKVARQRWTTATNPTLWLGVETVVIASGEDRAAADPLAAAGLCGAYMDTPLFLVSSTSVPNSVKKALSEINATHKNTKVIVVGGPVSVPDARLAEIAALMPDGAGVERLVATGDRFDLAAAIAERIAAVAGVPDVALVANGADDRTSSSMHWLSRPWQLTRPIPILLVNEDSIPAATRNALNQLALPRDVVIGGGPATVSDGVMSELDAQYGDVVRWSGNDRYRTAQAIADGAMGNNWLSDDLVGVAAKLPDALTGGATLGQSGDGGVLLITNGETLTPSTGSWLAGHKVEVDKCAVIGGPVSITDSVKNDINSKLQ